MNELVINTHDFEEAKNGLKNFSEQATPDLNLKKVAESKSLGEWFSKWLKGEGIGTDHNVTGAELNDLTSQIQRCLIDINNVHIGLIKEFGQVYSALESLDKDYIQAILISIKATEKTSKAIADTQDKIHNTVKIQGKTLKLLENFQKELNRYEHLKDVDLLWNDFQELHQNTTKLSDGVNGITAKIQENEKSIVDVKEDLEIIDSIVTDLGNDLNNQIEKFNTVFEFTEEIRKIVHLKNIDEMWESLVDTRISLNKVRGDLGTVRNDVQSLLDFKAEMAGYEHLNDIDDIWDKTEKHSDEIKSLDAKYDDTDKRLSDAQNHIDSLEKYIQKLRNIAHLNDVDKLWESNNMHSGQISELHRQGEEMSALIYSNKELVDSYIAKIEEKNESIMQTLTKKIKYSYLIAGSAVCLAVIELIIILLR